MAQPAGVGSAVNRDLNTVIRIVPALVPAVKTATATGLDINLKKYESAVFNIAIGANGDTWSTSVYQTWKFQHADDNGSGAAGSYADCAAADLIDDQTSNKLTTGTIVMNGTTYQNAVYQIGYIGGKQWVRVQMLTTGTHTTGTPVAATVIKGHARVNPA
jgi:hypothetical protein